MKSGTAVQSIGFRRFLPIGAPEVVIHYLDRWGIDEIIVLHIDATGLRSSPSAREVGSYARKCRVPLSVGGGVRSVSDVKRIITAGADKIVLNSALAEAPDLVTQAAELFGSQCVVVSVDGRRQPDGTHVAYTHAGTLTADVSPAQLASRGEALGAGEILIRSIDHDGTRQGYDLDLLRATLDAVRIPVICSGGAGHPRHLQAAIESGASAVAVGNLFNFTEHSVILTKRFLESEGLAVRLDSYATYRENPLGQDGRVGKLPDDVLEALRFHYIPEEVL